MLSPGVHPTNSQVGRSKTQAERKVGAMSNYMARTPARSLSTGQIIRGEVTDLRNREITITMEDNTAVTGQLPDGSHLSIGETAAFLITGIQPDKISLELLQNSLQSSERITVQKALEKAGLPVNEKNQGIVRELLHNNMPIHKQSILNILTQSYQFKDVSIPVLVAMNHLGMEITEDSAAQFENCCTRETTLTGDTAAMSSALLAALKDEKIQPDAELIKRLLNLLVFPEPEEDREDIPDSPSSPAPSLESASPVMNGGLSSIFGFHRLAGLLSGQHSAPAKTAETDLPPGELGMLSPADREELSHSISVFTETQKKVLEELTKPEKPVNPMAFYQKPVEISEELKSLLDRINGLSDRLTEVFSSDHVLLRDAITLFQENRTLADDIDFFQIKETRNHFLEKHPAFPKLLETAPDSPECTQLSELLEKTLQKVPSSSSLLSPALAERMEHAYSQYLQEKGTIASTLSSEELRELAAAAKNFPFRPDMENRLSDGDVTPKEFFMVLKNTASLVSGSALHAMVSTDAFGKLLEQSLLSSFALTPKELLQQGKTEKFFDETYERLQEFSHTLSEFQSSSGGSDFLDLANQKSNHMQKQLEFFKSLNEMYTYLQIPVKLKHGIKTSDLYVYTKKEAMRSNPKQLSVLLHLDMDSLGPLDIHLTLQNATVTSHIYCQEEGVKKFLSAQLPSLKTALQLRGYFLEAEINERQKPFDFVRDFIQKKEQPSSAKENTSEKRYTFDIRA